MKAPKSGSLALIIIIFLWAMLVIVGYYYTHKPVSPTDAAALLKPISQIIIALSLVVLSGGIGRTLLIAAGITPLERVSLQAALGSGILALVWLLIGLLNLYFWWSAWALLGVGLFAFRRQSRLWLFDLAALKSLWKGSSIFARMLTLICTFFSVTQLFFALAPPFKWDALMYHLELPRRYLEAGGFVFIPWNPYWGHPQLAELLYTWGVALGGLEVAQLLGWAFMVLLIFGILGFLSALAGTNAAWLAVAALLAGLSIRGMMSWAYVDGLAALFGFAALISTLYWIEKGHSGWLLWSGVFAGFAVFTKLTAAILLPILILTVLIYHFFPSFFKPQDRSHSKKSGSSPQQDRSPDTGKSPPLMSLRTFLKKNPDRMSLRTFFVKNLQSMSLRTFFETIYKSMSLQTFFVKIHKSMSLRTLFVKQSPSNQSPSNQRSFKSTLKLLTLHCSLITLIPLFIFLPWLLLNTHHTGNPLYPHLFPTEFTSFERLSFFGKSEGFPGWHFAFLPLALTWFGVEAGALEGLPNFYSDIGPLLVMFSLPAIILFWKLPAIRLLAVWLLGGWIFMLLASWYSALLSQSRLYFVLLPAVALAAGWGWSALERVSAAGVRLSRLMAAIVLLVLLFNLWQDVLSLARLNPVGVVLGTRSVDAYQDQTLGMYAKTMRAIAKLPPESQVLFLWEPRGLYAPISGQPDSWIDRWYLDRNLIGDPFEIKEFWLSQGFSYILINLAGMEFERQNRLQLLEEDWLAFDQLMADLPVIHEFDGFYRLVKLVPNNE
jgi:hypothetical protein